MAGRRPKPTVLKLVQGNPGKRPLNKNEPKPTAGCSKPKFLKGRAARIWNEYAPELERLGLLTSVDAPMFAAWCQLVEEFEKNPQTMTAARISQMRGLAAAFGMEPSARARLSVKQDGDKEADPAERYFAVS
jgi:phage terminase small subunit